MARLIILHVAEDSAMARQLCGDLPEFRAVALAAPSVSEPFKVGAGVVLCLLWSPSAAGAADAFAALAELNQRNAVVLRLDNAPLAPALARLRLPLAEGFQSSQEISALFRAAGDQARSAPQESGDDQLRPDVWARRDVAARSPLEDEVLPSVKRSGGFAGGMARGFASSVAVLGISGGVTLGVSDQLRNEGFFILDASAAAAQLGQTAQPVVVLSAEDLYQPFGAVNQPQQLGTFEQLSVEADALRDLSKAERNLIAERLADVSASLDATRKLTDARIEMLEQAAGGASAAPLQLAQAAAAQRAVQTAQAAPPRVVERAVQSAAAPPAQAQYQQAELLLTKVMPIEPLLDESQQSELLLDQPLDAELQTASLETAAAPTEPQVMSDVALPVTKLHDAAALILAKTIAARHANSGAQQI
jgi:hypothetical protein